jgi:hypothetical protein
MDGAQYRQDYSTEQDSRQPYRPAEEEEEEQILKCLGARGSGGRLAHPASTLAHPAMSDQALVGQLFGASVPIVIFVILLLAA